MGYLSFGIRSCFAAHSTVRLTNGTVKQMKDLVIGDEVETVSMNSKKRNAPGSNDQQQRQQITGEKIYTWLHRDETAVRDFVEIHLATGNKICMTEDHFIMRAKNNNANGEATKKNKKPYEFVTAAQVRLGDVLYQHIRGTCLVATVPVIGIELLKQRAGVYAPATLSGTILVDDIVCSCYAQFERFTSHKLAHMALAPMRWTSSTKKMMQQQRQIQPSGIHPYCMFNIKLYECYKHVAAL